MRTTGLDRPGAGHPARRRARRWLVAFMAVALAVAVPVPAQAAATGSTLNVSPAGYDFGSVAVSASASYAFAVWNDGATGATFAGRSQAGSTAFTVVKDDCSALGGPLPPGGTCQFTVRFAPDAAGAVGGSISYTFDAGAATVDLLGTGTPKLTVSPAPYDFGPVLVGSQSTEQHFTLTNNGTTASTTTSPVVGAGDFWPTADACVGILAAGASCGFDAMFWPVASGAQSGTLVHRYDSGDVAVKLTGTGTPKLTVSPPSYDFGGWPVTGQTPAQHFTITNNTATASTLQGVSNSNSRDFVVTADTCGATLAAGTSCGFDAAFWPAFQGTVSGTVVHRYDSGDATASLSGTGTPPQLSISPPTHDFGPVQVGASATTRVTITNNSTVAATPSSGRGARNWPVFDWQNDTCLVTLAPGASCTFDAVFTPGTAGAIDGYLDHRYDLGRVVIVLSGTGVADTTLPGATFSTMPSTPTNTATLSYGLTFSEPVTGLAASDFSISGTATGCIVGEPAGSGAAYTVDVTGCSEGSLRLTLKAGSVADLAGNAGPAAEVSGDPVTVDRTAPTATITAPASPTNLTTVSYGITFSEPVTGLAASDFSVPLCTVGEPVGSGAAYTVDVRCSGNVNLTLAAGSVADGAGNAGPDSPVAAGTVVIDLNPPSAAFTPVYPDGATNADPILFVLRFWDSHTPASSRTEPVLGFTASDLSVSGVATGCVVGPPAYASGDAYYRVTVAGCSKGTMTLTLAAGSVTDQVGNAGPYGSVSETYTVDRVAPSATLSAPTSPTNATALMYTVQFSEPILSYSNGLGFVGLLSTDFALTGTATGCVISGAQQVGGTATTASTFTVGVSGCSPGTVVLTLKAGVVMDPAHNYGPPAAVSAGTVTIDTTPPAATLSRPASPTNLTTLSYGLTFSEPVTGLAASDFSISGTGCIVGGPAGSGAAYTVDVTGCYGGSVMLTLRAGSVADLAGQSGPPADVSAGPVAVDRTAPTATITAPASPTNALTLSYGLTFSEPVTGLAAADLSIAGSATGCTVGSIANSGLTWSVAVIGCSEGSVRLTLGAGSVADAAGNTGPAADTSAGAGLMVDRTAPAAPSVGSVGLRAGTALSGTAIPATVTWSPSSDGASGAGLAAAPYTLQRSLSGGAWTTLGRYPGTSAAVYLPASGTVQFRVLAADAAGNVATGPASISRSARLVQQSSTAVRYSGAWYAAASTAFSGGSAKWARTRGASASYTFTGRGIALVSTRSPSRGRVKIYVDGVYAATVDLYRATTQYRALAWTRTWTATRTHAVKLVVLGTSGRPRVDLDAFALLR
jgi:hypothetical protein